MTTAIPVKSSITTEKVARYVIEKINPDSAIERGLRLDTLKLPNAGMISSSDVGALLAVLAQSVNTKRAIEVGTFTGYTALKVAQTLPDDGKLFCCDISREWADIGAKYWQEAKVDRKIELRIAPALETLNNLMYTIDAGHFDFAFIDADKASYESYYEACLKLVRPGGLIILDNMLWNGSVADESVKDATTVILRELNKKISADFRVNACLLTVGDGLMLARKK